MSGLDRSYRILRKPVITEKATDDATLRNAYHFRVPVDANKVEIRQAVEQVFGVKVVRVNTSRVLGRWRRVRFAAGRTPDWKKARVTLAEGHSIDIL